MDTVLKCKRQHPQDQASLEQTCQGCLTSLERHHAGEAGKTSCTFALLVIAVEGPR